MKAVRVGTYGGPEVLQVTEMPIPTPGEQDVVVHVAAMGVTFDDVLDRTGETEREIPYIPGFEAVGTIVAVGAHVSSRSIGERVACLAPAAFAEHLVAPQEHVVPSPQHLDDLQAVASVRAPSGSGSPSPHAGKGPPRSSGAWGWGLGPAHG